MRISPLFKLIISIEREPFSDRTRKSPGELNNPEAVSQKECYRSGIPATREREANGEFWQLSKMFWLRSAYRKMSLQRKISIPFIVVFVALWFVGTGAVGYYFSENLELRQEDEVKALSKRILREFEYEINSLNLNVRLLAENVAIRQSLAQGDKRALLKELLPLRSTLSSDFIKIVDDRGHVLMDLRSRKLDGAKIDDRVAISQAIGGANLSSLLVAEAPDPSVLVGTAPIKSIEGILGGILFGKALSDRFLEEISQDSDLYDIYIVALNGKSAIASTLPDPDKIPPNPPFQGGNQIQWSKLLRDHSGVAIEELQIGEKTYLAKTVFISGLDNAQLQLLLLSSLDTLQQAKQRLWIGVILFYLVGAAISWAMGDLISKAIARPIHRLTDATKKLADGDLTARLPVVSADELSQLAIGFNVMAEQIQIRDRQISSQMKELEDSLDKLASMPQLIHSEKMSGLGQMVAGIAHEFNNPVSFIYGNLIHAEEYFQNLLDLIQIYQEILPNSHPLVEECLEEIDLDFLKEDLPKVLQSMQSGADRIRSIVSDLRNFSRLDEADLKTVDLHQGIENTLMILKHQLKSEASDWNIQIIKEYGNLPPVECYAAKLNQVFINILNNAIDAIAAVPNPTIVIRTHFSETQQGAIVAIIDNGCGMSQAVLSKIFDPFFTTKAVGQGTGLGLATSYQIVVKNHGGTLECFSEVNKGTEVRIFLPVRAFNFHSKNQA